MVVGVSYHAGDYKCLAISQMIVGVSYHAGECECWALLTSRSDISAGRSFLMSTSDISAGRRPT